MELVLILAFAWAGVRAIGETVANTAAALRGVALPYPPAGSRRVQTRTAGGSTVSYAAGRGGGALAGLAWESGKSGWAKGWSWGTTRVQQARIRRAAARTREVAAHARRSVDALDSAEATAAAEPAGVTGPAPELRTRPADQRSEPVAGDRAEADQLDSGGQVVVHDEPTYLEGAELQAWRRRHPDDPRAVGPVDTAGRPVTTLPGLAAAVLGDLDELDRRNGVEPWYWGDADHPTDRTDPTVADRAHTTLLAERLAREAASPVDPAGPTAGGTTPALATWERTSGGGVLPAGDIGGDRQVGQAYSVRYSRPDRSGALSTVAYYVEDLDAGGDGPPRYAVTEQTELVRCADPGDPAGTELWADSTRRTFPETFHTAEHAEHAARACAEQHRPNGLIWDGRAPWERDNPPADSAAADHRNDDKDVLVGDGDLATTIEEAWAQRYVSARHDEHYLRMQADAQARIDAGRTRQENAPAPGQVVSPTETGAPPARHLSVVPAPAAPGDSRPHPTSDAPGPGAVTTTERNSVMTVTTGETTNIEATRTYLSELAGHVQSDILSQLELADSTLRANKIDQATLGELDGIREQFNQAVTAIGDLVTGINERHAAVEEAVNSTPEVADTDWYRNQ